MTVAWRNRLSRVWRRWSAAGRSRLPLLTLTPRVPLICCGLTRRSARGRALPREQVLNVVKCWRDFPRPRLFKRAGAEGALHGCGSPVRPRNKYSSGGEGCVTTPFMRPHCLPQFLRGVLSLKPCLLTPFVWGGSQRQSSEREGLGGPARSEVGGAIPPRPRNNNAGGSRGDTLH